MKRLIWLLPISVLLSTACSTSSVMVRSVPEGADVQFVSKDGNVMNLGKTPLEIDAQKMPGLFTEPGQIHVSKAGFTPQGALLPRLGQIGGNGRITFTLAQTELPKICTVNEDIASEIAKNVTEVASMIQRKRYSDAGALLQTLINKYPNVPVFYELRGNVAYLQRDMTRALESFKQSNALTPNNPSTLRMIERLQALQGGQQ